MSCVVRPEAKSDGFPWLPDSGAPTPDEPQTQNPIWPSGVREGLPRVPRSTGEIRSRQRTQCLLCGLRNLGLEIRYGSHESIKLESQRRVQCAAQHHDPILPLELAVGLRLEPPIVSRPSGLHR